LGAFTKAQQKELRKLAHKVANDRAAAMIAWDNEETRTGEDNDKEFHRDLETDVRKELS
jgi:hypothetical protein